MSFDWIFENIGALLDFWYSFGSIFFVMAVPIEVMISAFFGGFAYSLFLPNKWNFKYILLISLIPTVGGPFGENRLQILGRMKYSGGWTWIHAVIAYFFTWLLLSFVWYFVIKRKG
jgi:hypothetical protein